MIISFLISYLLDLFPLEKLSLKSNWKDITKTGSQNIGATMYTEVYLKSWFISINLRWNKPIIALVIIFYFFNDYYQNYKFLYFFITIVGHIFPIWLMFKGGKGVACFFGGFLMISPIPTLISMAVWMVTVKITKISSLGALLSIFLLTSYQIVSNYGTLNKGTIFAIMLLIFWKHSENIKRLIQGKENKINL